MHLRLRHRPEIPTGVPLVYGLDPALNITSKEELGDRGHRGRPRRPSAGQGDRGWRAKWPPQSLKELRAELLHDTSVTGTAWCHNYAEIADAWLTELFDSATGSRPEGVALLAVGGYGRGILAPGSDLDLLLVHEPKRRVGTDR